MKSKFLLVLFAGGILITGAGCQTDTYTHPKFGERSARLTNVVFLPPQITTGLASNLFVLQVGPPLPEEAKYRAQLPALLAAEFRGHRLPVSPSGAETLLPDATNQIWNAHLQGILNAAYNTVRLKAVRPEANVLAGRLSADGLIFLSVFAYKSTDGRQAAVALVNLLSILAAAGGGYGTWTPSSQAIVQIALVDGVNGDVLWRTIHDFTAFDQMTPDQVVTELFKKYPEP